jgi:ATP-binding cassette subfamily B protein
MKVIQAFTREKQQQRKFRASADDLMGQAISLARLFTFLFPFIFLIANLGQAAILYVGGRQIIAGLLSIGEWQEFSLYLMYLLFPIAWVSSPRSTAERGFADPSSRSPRTPTSSTDRAIALPAVRARCDSGVTPLLRRRRPGAQDVTFEAQPGQRVAARRHRLGKHHHQPASREARPRRTIDGPLRHVKLDSLRRLIGIVLRRPRYSAGPSARTSPSGSPRPAMPKSWRQQQRPRRMTSSWTPPRAIKPTSASEA